MIKIIDDYLDVLDKVISTIPSIEKVLKRELIDTSYGLIKSNNILIDIQYIDYLICFMLNKKYINYSCFLLLGNKLENIIIGLKVRK